MHLRCIALCRTLPRRVLAAPTAGLVSSERTTVLPTPNDSHSTGVQQCPKRWDSPRLQLRSCGEVAKLKIAPAGTTARDRAAGRHWLQGMRRMPLTRPGRATDLSCRGGRIATSPASRRPNPVPGHARGVSPSDTRPSTSDPARPAPANEDRAQRCLALSPSRAAIRASRPRDQPHARAIVITRREQAAAGRARRRGRADRSPRRGPSDSHPSRIRWSAQ
jgi:hypothetical protein